MNLFRSTRVLLLLWLSIFCLGSCTHKNSPSQLDASSQQPSIQALDALEPLVPKNTVPVIQKPLGKLAGHLMVDAGGVQIADANLIVNLKGTFNSVDQSVMKLVRWTQIEGPEVTILNPREPNTAFIAPDVAKPTKLEFRLYGINANDFANTDTATVFVKPLQNSARVVTTSASEPKIISENASGIAFEIKLLKAADRAFVMEYETVDGTAVAGEDYVAKQGRLVFQKGESSHILNVALINDQEPEDFETFELKLSWDPLDDDIRDRISISGVGVIVDDGFLAEGVSFPTTKPLPVDKLPTTLTDPNLLNGQAGLLRAHLNWADISQTLKLEIRDACGTLLSQTRPAVNCLGSQGNFEFNNTNGWNNASWKDFVAEGKYSVWVEHASEDPVDYNLNVFWGEKSKAAKGTIANRQRVKVMELNVPQLGQPPETSSESSSSLVVSSSSSFSSSESSSSSVISSSASSNSAVISSSASSSSSVISSSASSSSAVISSSASSSSAVISSSESSSSAVISSSESSSSSVISSNESSSNSSVVSSRESSSSAASIASIQLSIKASNNNNYSILIEGVATADKTRQLNLTAKLENVATGIVQTIPLVRQNEFFSFTLSQFGKFKVVVTANDGVNEVQKSINVTLDPPALGVSLAHEHPVDDNQTLDIIDLLELQVFVENPLNLPLNRFSLEFQGADGWFSAATYDANKVWDYETRRAYLNFDFTENDWSYKLYTARVKVDYLDGYSAASQPIHLNYRALAQPQINLVSAPSQGLFIGQTLPVAGSYQLDPLTSLSGVYAVLYGLSPQGAPVALSEAIKLSASNGQFKADIAHARLSELNSIEFYVRDQAGAESARVNIPVTFVPQKDLFIRFIQPSEDKVPLIRPWLDITANYFVHRALNAKMALRMLNAAGKEMLVEPLTDNAAWILDTNGTLKGRFDFSKNALPSGVYTLELSATYSGNQRVVDQLLIDYTLPALPSVSLVQPIAQKYSFDVPIQGAVKFDAALGAPSIKEVLATLELQNSDINQNLIPFALNYTNGQFTGELPQSAFAQSGNYVLSVWALDELGRTSTKQTVKFGYDLPSQFLIRLQTPSLPVTRPLNVFATLELSGQVQFQQGYPLKTFDVVVLQNNQDVRNQSYFDALDDQGNFKIAVDFEQLDLNDGIYSLQLLATDSENRQAQVSVPVNFAYLKAPSVSLTKGVNPDNSLLLAGAYKIQYSVDSRLTAAKLTANITHADGTNTNIPLNIPTPFTASAAVEINVPDNVLKAGLNTINITLNDGYATATASSEVNFTAPVITLVAPQANSTSVGVPVNVQFRVAYAGGSSTGLPKAQVFLDGVALPNKQPVTTQTIGVFQYTFSPAELTAGAHRVAIQVADYRLSTLLSASTGISFNYINPTLPVLSLSQPIAQTYTQNVAIAGRVVVDNALTASSITRVNARLEIQRNNSFSALKVMVLNYAEGAVTGQLTPTDLTEFGTYNLVAWAEDQLGRKSAEQTVRFTYRPAVAKVSLLANPKGDDTRVGGPYTLGYTLDSRLTTAKISAVIRHADGSSVNIPLVLPSPFKAQGSVNFDVADAQLASGINTLVVTLDDGFNTPVETSSTLTFQPPSVTIVAPQNNFNVVGVPVNIQFNVSYMNGISAQNPIPKAQIQLNGTVLTNTSLVASPASGAYGFTLNPNELRAGANTLSIQVADYRVAQVVSNLASITINYSNPLPPTVSITAPVANARIEGGAVNVLFKVGYSGITAIPAGVPSAELRLNSQSLPNKLPTTTQTAGVYQYSFAANELREGANKIEIRVTDIRLASVISGLTAVDFNYFNVPSVRITDFGSAAPGAGVPIFMTTAISNGGQIGRIEARVGNQVVTNLFTQANLLGNISATIPASYFVAGANTVTVRVFSANQVEGTAATLAYTFTPAFAVTVTSPTNGGTVDTTAGKISGRLQANMTGDYSVQLILNGSRLPVINAAAASSFELPLNLLNANGGNTLQVNATSGNQKHNQTINFTTKGPGGTLDEGADVVIFNDGNAFLSSNKQNFPFFENMMVFGDAAFQKQRTEILFDDRTAQDCSNGCEEIVGNLTRLAVANKLDLRDITPGSGIIYPSFNRNVPQTVRAVIIFGMSKGLINDEIDGLKQFVKEGGRLIVVGDHPGASGFLNPNTLNNFFTRLGVSVRNLTSNGATNNEALLPNSLATHPLLDGIKEVYIGGGGATTYGEGSLPLFMADRGPVVIVAKLIN